MVQPSNESVPITLELRFKRWTAVGVVCFLGLLAALPFRSQPHALSPTVAPSHRERSLRFRADSGGGETTEIAKESAEEPAKQVHLAPSVSQRSKTPATASQRQDSKTHVVSDANSTTASLTELTGESLWKSKGDSPSPPVATHCRARQGENLMDIAERALGDRRRWRELMELNSQFRSSFDEVPEGTQIALPRSAN